MEPLLSTLNEFEYTEEEKSEALDCNAITNKDSAPHKFFMNVLGIAKGKIKNQDLIFDFLVTPQVQKVNPLPELDGTLRSPYGKCPASAYPKEHALPVPACNALHGLHCTMARLPRQPKPVMMMPPQIIFTASKPPAGQTF